MKLITEESEKQYCLWGLGKGLTLVLLGIWYGWFTAVMSYPLPPVLFFCHFFGMLNQETLTFCRTSRSTMPYRHPGGERENGWYGVRGEIGARTLWTWTSSKRLKAFDQNSYSKLLKIFCLKTPQNLSSSSVEHKWLKTMKMCICYSTIWTENPTVSH